MAAAMGERYRVAQVCTPITGCLIAVCVRKQMANVFEAASSRTVRTSNPSRISCKDPFGQLLRESKAISAMKTRRASLLA